MLGLHSGFVTILFLLPTKCLESGDKQWQTTQTRGRGTKMDEMVYIEMKDERRT